MKKYKPKISVIMPVYNGERFLAESINSILGQTFEDYEFIIVDDGSTDSSVQIIQSYVDPRIRLFKRDHSGMDSSLNFAIEQSVTDIIAFCEQDDISVPERLKLEYETLLKNQECGVLSSAYSTIDEDGKVLYERRFPSEDMNIRDLFPVFCPIAFCSAMCRKDLLVKSGGFRKEMFPSNDMDLWLRLYPLTEYMNLENILTHKRIHPKAATQLFNREGRIQRLKMGLDFIKNIRRQTELSLHQSEKVRLQEAKLHYYFGSMKDAKNILLKMLIEHPMDLKLWRYFLPSLIGDKIFTTMRSKGITSAMTKYFREKDYSGKYFHI